MIKRFLVSVAAVVLFAIPASPEPWGGRTIAITAGTAIRIVGIRTMVSSLFIQMSPGGIGVGYVLYAPSGVTCSKGGAGTVWVATLSPATANSPGGNITLPFPGDPTNVPIDVAGYCIDGATNSDPVLTSWNLRN